jgi:hypothetical protein
VIGRSDCPDDELDSTLIVVALVGYLAEDEPGWPPAYAEALVERRDALGLVIEHFGVDAEQCADAVRSAREMLADSNFQRLRDAIGRALRQVPHLTAEDIEALCRATHTPIPTEHSCSTSK